MATDLDRIKGGEGAKFNSSLADLERIHNLLLAANEASINNNVRGWLGALRALDREIRTYINDDENDKLERFRVKTLPNDMRAQAFIVDKLNDYENELRKLRSTKKLGIVAEDDASTAAFR